MPVSRAESWLLQLSMSAPSDLSDACLPPRLRDDLLNSCVAILASRRCCPWVRVCLATALSGFRVGDRHGARRQGVQSRDRGSRSYSHVRAQVRLCGHRLSNSRTFRAELAKYAISPSGHVQGPRRARSEATTILKYRNIGACPFDRERLFEYPSVSRYAQEGQYHSPRQTDTLVPTQCLFPSLSGLHMLGRSLLTA